MLAGQAVGELSGFHKAMSISHLDFSFKADLCVTPGTLSTPTELEHVCPYLAHLIGGHTGS
jgi:hypothetical protein